MLERIEKSPVERVPFLGEDAALAAALVPATQPLGLSLGARVSGVGGAGKAPAWTADRAWISLDVAVKVEVIR